MPVFLTNIYRLVSALCLLQIGSSLAALCSLYDSVDDNALQYLPISPIITSVSTLWGTYRLLPYSRGSRIDTTTFSRVHRHYNQLLCNGISWVTCGLIISMPMLVSFLPSSPPLAESPLIPASLLACHNQNFMTAKCMPVGMTFVLPFVIGATYFAASQLLRLRARAIHGTEKVLMPQPIPRPWLYHVKDVPAWMTPHVAEFETVSLEEADTKADKA
ncbi:hypothetical protein C8R44DRAFT_868818 [Mycena epipterygia]|nr:hypothetical protein C8R44DRAFT_868818 [Mycena epipterygia]